MSYEEDVYGTYGAHGSYGQARPTLLLPDYSAHRFQRNPRIRQPACYGGLPDRGYGVLTTLGSRQVSGSGGYIYQQFSDGGIAILQGALPSGWRLGSVGPRDGAWKAITAAIGPYPATAAKDTEKASTSSSPWTKAAEFASSFATGLLGAGTAVAQPTVGSALSAGASASPMAPDKKFPWGWVGLAVGGVAVVGTGIYFATRKKK